MSPKWLLVTVATLCGLWAGTTKSSVVFQHLHSFLGLIGPTRPLIQSRDGNLYGTTSGGGAGDGTVYRITINGTFSVLYSFTGRNDGAAPHAGLVQARDGNLYGTTSAGGDTGYGTIYRVTTNGTFSVLYSFTGRTDGAAPNAGLVQARDGHLYGTTPGSGANSNGTLFRITTNGTFTTLYSFSGGDGNDPEGGLVQAADNNLYGTTSKGGSGTNGTVFRVTTDGTLTTVYSFTGWNDGAAPNAGLVQASDGNLYGTTYRGGD